MISDTLHHKLTHIHTLLYNVLSFMHLIFFIILVFFNWNMIDLQYCVNFYTAEWLNCTHIYIFFHILFHYGLSQDIKYHSLCAPNFYDNIQCYREKPKDEWYKTNNSKMRQRHWPFSFGNPTSSNTKNLSNFLLVSKLLPHLSLLFSL